MGQIVIRLGSLPFLAFRLTQELTRIGRARDNDIVLSLPEIAAAHAEIVSSKGKTFLRACAGEFLFVNGKKVSEAELCLGVSVVLGSYHINWIPESEHEPAVCGDTFLTPNIPTMPLSLPTSSLGPVDRVMVMSGAAPQGTHALREQLATVGRSPDCDLVLSDESVSWRHLSLEPITEGVRVRDLGSSNGTLLNGNRVESAVATVGDRLRIGKTTLLLVGQVDGQALRKQQSAENDNAGSLVELVGGSARMKRLYAHLREAAASKVPVLLRGETGTGKELAARAIHMLGARAEGPFVPVNCAAIPREILEAELFGHTRGAFTGAQAERAGAFGSAASGTIFLDEIGEFPLELQPKLLRVIEDGQIPRVGGSPVAGDFRVIAATNRDLAGRSDAGRFRQDLYYRIAVLSIELPPLREHVEDIPVLVRAFLDLAEEYTGVADAAATRFDESAVAWLAKQDWPGNVRELRNLVYRAIVRAPGAPVSRELIEGLMEKPALSALDAAMETSGSLREIERRAIEKALQDHGGQRRAAARRLGIAESTLYEKIHRYGLG